MSPDHPTGAVPRVEKQVAHTGFVADARPDAVLTSVTAARRIAEGEGATAAEWFPDTTVVTAAVDDPETRVDRPPERERDVVAAFAPDFHVPGNFPLYDDYDLDDRVAVLEAMTRRAAYLHDEFGAEGPTVIPVVNGPSRPERGVPYALADAVDPPMLAYDARPAFLPGGDLAAVRRELRAVAAERSEPLLVMGVGAPGVVETLPEAVAAVSGKRAWLRAVDPTANYGREVRLAYEGHASAVAEALATAPDDAPDDPPDDAGTATGTAGAGGNGGGDGGAGGGDRAAGTSADDRPGAGG